MLVVLGVLLVRAQGDVCVGVGHPRHNCFAIDHSRVNHNRCKHLVAVSGDVAEEAPVDANAWLV